MMSRKGHKMTKGCRDTRYFKSAPQKTESHRNWIHRASDTIRSQKSTPKSRSFLVGLLKKEHFLSIRGPGMCRKNDPRNQNDGEFLQRKGPFLANFTRCQKSDKKRAIITVVSRMLSQKRTLFVKLGSQNVT